MESKPSTDSESVGTQKGNLMVHIKAIRGPDAFNDVDTLALDVKGRFSTSVYIK